MIEMKKLLITMFASVATLGSNAQDINTLFRQMPDQYIPQLENAWRKDITDLYNEGKDASLKNNMNGTSVLELMNEDYLRLKSTESTRIEMRRLPLINNTYVICMVTTYFGPVADSKVEFFSTDWKPLNTGDIINLAKREDFFKADNDTTSIAWQEVNSFADFDLIEYRLDENEPTLTAIYNTPEYLPKEMLDKINVFIKNKEKKYTWKNSRFE